MRQHSCYWRVRMLEKLSYSAPLLGASPRCRCRCRCRCPPACLLHESEDERVRWCSLRCAFADRCLNDRWCVGESRSPANLIRTARTISNALLTQMALSQRFLILRLRLPNDPPGANIPQVVIYGFVTDFSPFLSEGAGERERPYTAPTPLALSSLVFVTGRTRRAVESSIPPRGRGEES